MAKLLQIDGAHTSTGPATSATGGWLGRFLADQTGSMSIFAVAGSLVMMVFGGIAVDMIYAELQRNKIQNTLDRAVLAAADINNSIDPKKTVEEYFAAMGINDTLDGVTVSGTANSRSVLASSTKTMPSNFLQLLGVKSLQAEGLAAAENGNMQLEVSLVLDISGSMSGTKIEQLRTAAKSFVSTLLTEDTTDSVSVSLIPYHATVSLGDTTSRYFTMEGIHDYSHCATFEDDDFTTTGIRPGRILRQLGHFDPVSSAETMGNLDRPWCYEGDDAAVMVHSSDIASLHARIDTLQAYGNTAIDLGMKWGVALLDPAAQPAVAAMAADGLVDAAHANRPVAFNSGGTMKFMVVMTDGENTTQYDLKDHFRTGGSGVFVNDNGTPDKESDDTYSVRVYDDPIDDANDLYYWTRYAGGSDPSLRYQNAIDGGAAAVELSNADLYANLPIQSVANKFFYRPLKDGKITSATFEDRKYAYKSIVDWNAADARLSRGCAAARNKGIIVYAVGVEAPEAGKRAMQDCASSPAHYFDVSGDDLEETFTAIARSLKTLRLTQ